jgi:hypothetical protein
MAFEYRGIHSFEKILDVKLIGLENPDCNNRNWLAPMNRHSFDNKDEPTFENRGMLETTIIYHV